MSSIQDKQKLIAVLGEMLSADLSDYSLDKDICRLAEEFHIESFLYCLSKGKIHPEFENIRAIYRHCNAKQLRNEFELQRLYALFEAEKIEFVPIKGSDLAYRIYPLAAMRPFADFDIWVKPENIQRFCQILAQDNWKCKLDYHSDHHLGARKKSNFLLEPHFSLPNLSLVSPEKLWQETIPVEGKDFQRRLSGELNLIMLFRHNSIDAYRNCNILKLLLDVEFLLRKESIDWKKVSRLCIDYQVPHPGILFAAFPEFFRNRYQIDQDFPEEVVRAARTLLLSGKKDQETDAALNQTTAAPGKLSWWKTQLVHLSAENLKWKYRNIGDSKIKLHLYRIWDIIKKSFTLLRHYFAKPAPEIEQHIHLVQTVDDSWQNIKDK